MTKKAHKVFEAYLKDNDSRYTTQKRAIVEKISKKKNHFEVDSFLAEMNKGNERFSRATVYRTLKQLLDAGLLQKITAKDGRVYYEQNFGESHHDHLICNNCGKIIEIKDDKIGAIFNNYCDTLNFDMEYRSVHIYGTCKQCQKK
ncbi:transcriptional repressor [bacterium]|jgi:Fur family transcriptional regulator, ferric uptake regulator|nr:transcriptional repressor [bacterium]